ncbi:Protein FAR1-RELATED SEQUENCE 5 [Bienertia sinuspersici]
MEFTVFFHDYAYRKGFTFYTRTTELMKEYREMGVGRTAAGLKEPVYHMMKVIRLYCNYGGKKQTNGSIATGCPVYVFGCMVDDKTVIRKCQLEHNHCLSPKDSHLMLNYHSIDDPTAGKITNSDKAGISIAKSYNSLLVKSGGHENITYNQRDVRNVVHLNCRKSQLEGDAVALENLTLGDNITFDTTFLCNRYKIPFAPFVFNQWMKCMGSPPKGILSDQCNAVCKAVETVFVGVPHRFILWHILQNASRNLGKLSKWKEIEEALRIVVHDTLDPNEFDEVRGLMRSEGINQFFKGFVSIETGLLQFIGQYEAALKGKVEEDKLLNFNSTHKPSICDKDMIIQYVFQKAYTNTKFLK